MGGIEMTQRNIDVVPIGALAIGEQQQAHSLWLFSGRVFRGFRQTDFSFVFDLLEPTMKEREGKRKKSTPWLSLVLVYFWATLVLMCTLR